MSEGCLHQPCQGAFSAGDLARLMLSSSMVKLPFREAPRHVTPLECASQGKGGQNGSSQGEPFLEPPSILHSFGDARRVAERELEGGGTTTSDADNTPQYIYL